MTLHNLPLRCNCNNIDIHNGEVDLSRYDRLAVEMLQKARSQLLTPIYWSLSNTTLSLHCRDWKCFGVDFTEKLE